MKKLLLLCFCATGIIATSLASHMAGTTLTWKQTGTTTYRFTLKIYRDCRGDSVRGYSDSLTWFAGNSGSMGAASGRVRLTRTGIRDVTPICSSAKSGCSPANQRGSGEGIEEHTLIADVDLSKGAFASAGFISKYCELSFYYVKSARNGAITTGPAGDDFFTICTLNLCNLARCSNAKNSSVDFSNIPIIRASCNNQVVFTAGTMDTADFDSIGYSLVSPLKAYNTNVSFSSPYDYKHPVTPYCVPSGVGCTPNPKANPPRGFYFDTTNGDIIFTPTKCDEVAVFAMQVEEFRTDTLGDRVKLSTARYEIECEIKSADYNNAPTVEGPVTNKVCEGDKICFSIYGKDQIFAPNQTVADTVQMTWNSGIPGATFKIKNPNDREKEAEFCWQTRLGQGSDIAYAFTVTATDGHCPSPAKAIRGFKVKVNPRASMTRSYRCLDSGKLVLKAYIPASFKGVASFKWSVRDSLGNNESFFSSKQNDTVTLNYFGTHVIVCIINNSDNCPTIYRDTVNCWQLGTQPVSRRAVAFVVSPNPIASGMSFALPAEFHGTAEWRTVEGRLVAQDYQSGTMAFVPDLAPGFYMLRLNGNMQLAARVLVK